MVVSQKVVSKAEGRVVELARRRRPASGPASSPSGWARTRAWSSWSSGRAREVVRAERGRADRRDAGRLDLRQRRHRRLERARATDRVTLLPEDSDASAGGSARSSRDAAGAAPAVVIADSFGRPWRIGQTDVAIGCAGLTAARRLARAPRRPGTELAATAIAVADEVAAAADLVRAKDDGVPAADRSRARPLRHRRGRARARPPSGARARTTCSGEARRLSPPSGPAGPPR